MSRELIDDVDHANAFAEKFNEDSLLAHKNRPKTRGPKPEGYCLTCSEDFEDHHNGHKKLFCNQACARRYKD